MYNNIFFFFFQAEDGIRDYKVTGVQTCALPISYISAVNRLPMLTLEEEQDYARKLKEHSDLDAAGRLVMSHLRLVVSISRQYLGYGLPHGDLIQEGKIGRASCRERV